MDPEDDFYHLGGDSIMAIQLVSRARRAGVFLTARDVYLHKTAKAMAAVKRVVCGEDDRREQRASPPLPKADFVCSRDHRD